MTQLAEASTSSKSRLSHAVARLEQRGWVRRTNCPTDRRGQIAQLTDEGFASLAAAAPRHVERSGGPLSTSSPPGRSGSCPRSTKPSSRPPTPTRPPKAAPPEPRDGPPDPGS